MVPELNPIISLYSLNSCVFITETNCSYCEVRIGSLTVIQAKSILQRGNV